MTPATRSSRMLEGFVAEGCAVRPTAPLERVLGAGYVLGRVRRRRGHRCEFWDSVKPQMSHLDGHGTQQKYISANPMGRLSFDSRAFVST